MRSGGVDLYQPARQLNGHVPNMSKISIYSNHRTGSSIFLGPALSNKLRKRKDYIQSEAQREGCQDHRSGPYTLKA